MLKVANRIGKIPESTEPNEEIALDFAGPFQNANLKKKYLLVSVDNHSGWPNALFLPNPTTEKVIEFLLEYIAANGLPKRIRTDPGTVFKSKKFKEFCTKNFIEHTVCPVRDHRGNGKVERMIRTINERLRSNKEIIISKEKKGLSKLLFALRSERGSDGKSAFGKHLGRKRNTPKSRLIEKCILEKDPAIEIEPEDFSEEADSTILVRERVRGTKLESVFKRVKGQVVSQSNNTITVIPEASKRETIYSKRDIATGSSGQKGQKERKEGKGSKLPKSSEQANKIEKPKLKRKVIESDDTEAEDFGQSPPRIVHSPET